MDIKTEPIADKIGFVDNFLIENNSCQPTKVFIKEELGDWNTEDSTEFESESRLNQEEDAQDSHEQEIHTNFVSVKHETDRFENENSFTLPSFEIRGKNSCIVCSYTTSNKSKLIRHIRTHTGEKPFTCRFCGYKSSDKGNLTCHERIHTFEKPFNCTFCDYKCSTKSNLVSHLKTHTGEKPFCCMYCDYKAYVRARLVEHVRTHTGEKPFKCSLCDYKCSIKSRLTRHMKTHKGKGD